MICFDDAPPHTIGGASTQSNPIRLHSLLEPTIQLCPTFDAWTRDDAVTIDADTLRCFDEEDLRHPAQKARLISSRSHTPITHVPVREYVNGATVNHPIHSILLRRRRRLGNRSRKSARAEAASAYACACSLAYTPPTPLLITTHPIDPSPDHLPATPPSPPRQRPSNSSRSSHSPSSHRPRAIPPSPPPPPKTCVDNTKCLHSSLVTLTE
ncbi:hypothetical protein R3P38DRAFT_3175158 [Favolaschia claudopus]|uniref:Uncharacterized protein n=1 Tax=Favolaschia claudopus TaxID=2862362 RepID=A0AAW0DEE8_9AGAR